MGAKTALLVYTTGDPADLLRMPPPPDHGKTSALVAATHPGWTGTGEVAGGTLADHICPPEGSVYAGSFPGIDLLCDEQVMVDRPSQLPAQFREPGAGRRTILHVMHSVTDCFAYAIWQDATLLRSLSLIPAAESSRTLALRSRSRRPSGQAKTPSYRHQDGHPAQRTRCRFTLWTSARQHYAS